MWLWWFMLGCNLLIPAIMLGAGWMMYKHCPKDINWVYGYRTARSMDVCPRALREAVAEGRLVDTCALRFGDDSVLERYGGNHRHGRTDCDDPSACRADWLDLPDGKGT